jgi:hypothetical protein
MMKKNYSIAFVLVIVSLFSLVQAAYSMDGRSLTDDTVLLLQQSNPGAGTVSPGLGVHHFGLNEEVTLSATPRPGYRFMYWLGEVTDPVANRTIVYLDAPKIIIAVFEQAEFGFLVPLELQNTLGGIGGLRPSSGDYSNTAGGGDIRWPEYKWPEPPRWNPPSPPEEPELPDEFPIPQMPEPATVLLLGLGGLLFIRRRPANQYKNTTEQMGR